MIPLPPPLSLSPVLAILAGIDIASTRHVLAAGGVELNPFMVPIVGSVGLFYLVKVAVILAICGLAWIGSAYLYPRAGTVVMTSAALIFTLPVVWNLAVIFA